MEEFSHSPKIFHIFAKLLDGKTATLRFQTPTVTSHQLKDRIFEITKVPTSSQRLICGATQLQDHTILSTPECTVHVALRLVGGKGGFGSLLRGAATKAGQKKTNNFDACRDMSGRRLRHVNAEKRLEEWKAEEEERKLERIAAEFIKKEAKKKKGPGYGEADKYVEKYREDSAKCSKIVEEAVREACALNKRKKKPVFDNVDSKRLKIWMGKRKKGGSDSGDMDEDSSDDDEERENEMPVVLNNSNHSDSSKEAGGSFDSVTGGKENGEISRDSCMSSFEDEREVCMEQQLIASPLGEIVGTEEVKSEFPPEKVVLSATENPESEISKAVKQDNVGLEELTISNSGEVTVRKPDANGSSQTKSELNEAAVLPSVENGDVEKPLDFDEFNSAADLEVLGLERLKTELQIHGLKCGGSLQERAARLFLLKTTPLEKLPKKLFAKK